MRISDWSSDVCASDLGGVANNPRHGDCHADEHEDLASLGRGGIPNRHGRRYDVRPHRYAEPGHTEEEQRQAEPEGLAMPFDRQGTQQGQRNDAGQDWYGSSAIDRSEEHTSELQSLMRNSY